MKRILVFFCFIGFNTIYAQYSNFSLSGQTSNIEDGTNLYFRDLVNGGNIDSTMVINNSFRFNTELIEPTMFVMLFTKDRTNYTELWLENNPMTFDASKVDFKEAKVNGSKNHVLFKKLKEEIWADYQAVDETIMKQRERDFIKSHPDAVVSSYMLFANTLWDQNQIGEFFSSLSAEVRNSSMSQRKVVPYLEKDLPETGENYLDFSITNSVGENKKISELTGKLTLIQFWDSKCPPSRSMNTMLTEVYKKYHSKGFEIIGISKDTNKEDWLQAIMEDKLNWPQMSNLQSWEGEVFKAYAVSSTPSNFLINSQGIIVERNLKGDEIEKQIQEHLSK